jgi:hypothetical protein
MSSLVTPGLVGFAVGILSTLITIFLTPWIQFRFWGRQRLSEVRLATIAEANSLLSDFMTHYMANSGFRPSEQFFASFMAASANIKALFSENAFRAFKNLEVFVGPNLGPAKGAVDAVIEARDVALRALYGEAIGRQPK